MLKFKKKILFITFILLTNQLFAHQGPPYPILINHPFLEYKLSLWADPDVGEGTFQLFLEGGLEQKKNELTIDLVATPVIQLKERNQNIIKLQSKAIFQKPDQLNAILPFPTEGMWIVTFMIKHKEITLHDFSLEIEVTPPGPTKLEFLLYLFPFAAVAFIWIKIILKRRTRKKI